MCLYGTISVYIRGFSLIIVQKNRPLYVACLKKTKNQVSFCIIPGHLMCHPHPITRPVGLWSDMNLWSRGVFYLFERHSKVYFHFVEQSST